MLKKLLKYDVRAIWKLWAALSVALIGMAVILSFIIRLSIASNLMDETSILSIFLVLGSVFMGFGVVMAWSGILIVTPIMCYIRYFKNFFSDEGYLTFTLPVKRRDLYLSKVVNVFLFNAGNVLVTIIAVLLFLLIIPGTGNNGAIINFEIFVEFWKLIAMIWEAIGGWMLVYLLGIILLMAVCSLYQIGMIHLCITVGATVAKKHKVLAALGIYIGVDFILSTLYQVFGMFGIQSVEGLILLLDKPSEPMIHLTLIAIILLVIVAIATAAWILHLVTLNTIERKLNLA
ncbi:MAG: hypothetical protein IJW00_02055 [Clostridia bacterium]|nr:hypothetical protein [Clostridia bacterium]